VTGGCTKGMRTKEKGGTQNVGRVCNREKEIWQTAFLREEEHKKKPGLSHLGPEGGEQAGRGKRGSRTGGAESKCHSEKKLLSLTKGPEDRNKDVDGYKGKKNKRGTPVTTPDDAAGGTGSFSQPGNSAIGWSVQKKSYQDRQQSSSHGS